MRAVLRPRLSRLQAGALWFPKMANCRTWMSARHRHSGARQGAARRCGWSKSFGWRSGPRMAKIPTAASPASVLRTAAQRLHASVSQGTGRQSRQSHTFAQCVCPAATRRSVRWRPSQRPLGGDRSLSQTLRAVQLSTLRCVSKQRCARFVPRQLQVGCARFDEQRRGWCCAHKGTATAATLAERCRAHEGCVSCATPLLQLLLVRCGRCVRISEQRIRADASPDEATRDTTRRAARTARPCGTRAAAATTFDATRPPYPCTTREERHCLILHPPPPLLHTHFYSPLSHLGASTRFE